MMYYVVKQICCHRRAPHQHNVVQHQRVEFYTATLEEGGVGLLSQNTAESSAHANCLITLEA